MKKVLALLLVLIMVFSMVACGKDENKTKDPEVTPVPTSELYQQTKRTIQIGTWYESYYTSAHDSIDDNPDVANAEQAQMQLDNMRIVEQRYNIELYYKNLTWNGVIESINTSIMAGSPTCDIYMVDLQFGIPAVINHYAEALDDFLEPDEINNIALKGFSFTSDGKTYLFKGNTIELGGMPLGYNKDMIEAANLEDPYELYQKGEWTWDAWMTMMEALTDTANGVYGYRGAWTNLTTQMLFSNGASIACAKADENGNITEGLSSQATTEVLNFMKEMYVDKGVTFWNDECDADWNSSVYAFGEGKAAFFNAAAWIIQEADPDQQINLGIVPWPLGPSVDSYDDVYSINQTSGTFYMIPKGVKEPKLVYNVIRDYTDWYGDDTTLRDDTEWFEQWMAGREASDTNFEVLKGMGDQDSDYGLELWDQVSFDAEYNISMMIRGNCEVAQIIETNKNLVQDYLDTNFAK